MLSFQRPNLPFCLQNSSVLLLVSPRPCRYGLREMRCHWERGFCYLVFSTFREAEYALKRLQAVAKDSDHALKGMVTNCYYI